MVTNLEGYKLINEGTGEIISIDEYKQHIQASEAFKAKQKREYFFRQHKKKCISDEIKSMMGNDFIQQHYTNTIEVCVNVDGQFDSAFAFRFIYLATYIDFNNILVDFNSKSKTRYITEKDLGDLLGLARKQLAEFKTRCFNNGLLEKLNIEGAEAIRVNKLVAVKGKAPAYYKRKSIRVSVPYIRDIYGRATIREHKGLGYLIAMLPFINYEYAVLCHNPEQQYKQYLQPLSIQDVCKILGYEKKNAGRLLKELRKVKLGEEFVFCIAGIGATDTFYLNPKVFFKGTTKESLKWLEELFECAKAWEHNKKSKTPHFRNNLEEISSF